MAEYKTTLELLKEVIHYDPITGIFTWKIRPAKYIKPGSRAGGPNKKGYWRVKVYGLEFPAARLAFFYMTGRFPQGDVDHKDRDPSNNKWDNLREATRSQNIANTGHFAHSAPYKGVSFYKATKTWRARIRVNGKLIALGLHKTPEAAHKAYKKAALHYFGEFARFE